MAKISGYTVVKSLGKGDLSGNSGFHMYFTFPEGDTFLLKHNNMGGEMVRRHRWIMASLRGTVKQH